MARFSPLPFTQPAPLIHFAKEYQYKDLKFSNRVCNLRERFSLEDNRWSDSSKYTKGNVKLKQEYIQNILMPAKSYVEMQNIV